MTTHAPRVESRRARARFGATFMSDTKWRKLFAVVAGTCPNLREMHVKFVEVEAVRTMRFPPSLSCPHAYMDTIEFGPTELRAIEWLELNAELSGALSQIGHFPLTITAEGRTRITGYGDPR